MQQEPERPFLLVVHMFDPHLNYDPPPSHPVSAAPGMPAAPVDGKEIAQLWSEAEAQPPKSIRLTR